MALRRPKKVEPQPEERPITGDTLSRIEAVTDRLEWLAEQIEKQLNDRENKDDQ